MPSAGLWILLIAFVSTSIADLAMRHPVHRRRQPVCINGIVEDGKCICDQDYVGLYLNFCIQVQVGRHCEKKKHCATFRRYRNGSCTACEEGFSGSFCEILNCEHGQLNRMGTACICEQPWDGEFCNTLHTEKVYSFYNRKVFLLGPLGALSMIPMCLTWFLCERMARKRQVKRVKNMMGGTIHEAVLHKMMVDGIDDI